MKTRKLNILVIPAWFDTGNLLTGIFFHEYCNALSRDAQITLLNFSVHPFRARFKKKRIKEDVTADRTYDLLTVDYFQKVPGRLVKSMADTEREGMISAALRAVTKHIQSHGKPDIIHLQSVYNNITPLIGAALSKKLDVPYIVTEHYTSFEKAGDRHFSPLTTFEEIRNIVNAASARIAVSNYATAYCGNCFGSNFETVYNIIGGDFNDITPTYFWDLPVPFQFLCIGSLSERKGQVYLLEAFALFCKQVPDSMLTLVGKGPEQATLEQLISRLGIEDKVRIINFLEPGAFVKLMDESSVIVSASQSELFGLTIVEGFFRGRPALATRSGGPEELIEPSNGLLCAYADIEGMYKNMRSIHDHYLHYDLRKISENARAKFSAEAIVPQMMEIYRNTVSAKDTKKAQAAIKQV